MINLLPEEEKQKLLFERKKRMATILGIVVLVAIICMTLILLSIKFYILAETDSQKGELKQAELEYKTTDFTNMNAIIKNYNSTLAQLDSFYKKEIYFNQVFKTVTGVPSPEGVRLLNFSLIRDEKSGLVRVNVSGISNTRDNLLIFKKSIEAGASGALNIKNPYFSPESWISPKNVNFSLTLEIVRNN